MFKRGKKAQVTIFVIIAIILVAAVLIYFLSRPSILTTRAPETPNDYIQNCMQDTTEKALDKLTLQGGSLNPTFYKNYKETKVNYLCYTDQFYISCSIRVPFLKQHIQNEIKGDIQGKVMACMDALKSWLENQGNKVTINKEQTDLSVDIVPNKVNLKITTDMTITKDTSVKYTELSASVLSPIFSQIEIASSILNWEARYGDSDILTYMIYYPDIKVEKMKFSDGSKIYTITDKITDKKFIFATRSMIWPAGITDKG